MTGTARIIRGNALDLPLADESVDLIVTSPPYFGLRSYQDGGEHYDGQIGAEPTPAEFVDALIAATREMVRVLKPTGSIWVNLGDKYATAGTRQGNRDNSEGLSVRETAKHYMGRPVGFRDKSLMGVPWRYAIRCIDDLGLILRAEVIWAKPNGLPESVTDRVRRSHETWFHLVKQPRYFSAVDEIREAHASPLHAPGNRAELFESQKELSATQRGRHQFDPSEVGRTWGNPLGKLPGSVWTVPTQPLRVPDHLGIDHFACVDTDTEILTRRGWLRHDEVQAGDECAGYDLDAGLARWTTVHAVHEYPFHGDLVSVEKRDLSMRLTPNHRVIAHKRTGRTGARGAAQVIRADELRPQHFIPRAATWQDAPATKAIGVDMAALLGWVAAEGWINYRRVMLSQSLTANPAKTQQIDALVRRLGGSTYRTRQRSWRGRDWTDCTWSLPRDLSADVMRLLPGKRLTWGLLWLPEDERRALLEAFIAGDGHIRTDGRLSIYQHIDNTVTVDVLQAIAVTLGYKTTRTRQATPEGDRWVLYLTQGGRSVTLRGTNGTLKPVGRERYDGIVWCPTTGTGTFVARRNGRVFITGNSFPMEWPRRIIRGWSPAGVCTACGEGRRPLSESRITADRGGRQFNPASGNIGMLGKEREYQITGYACACPDTTAPTTPATVLDPFGGTGTTALVAKALGRTGITVDLSYDYCRLAEWRTNDRDQLAAAMQVDKPTDKPLDGQLGLFGDDAA